MFSTKLLLAASLFTATTLIADDAQKKEDEARAALELAKAKTKPKKADKEAFLSLDTAKGVARVTGKDVVLIRYGDFKCLDTCPKINIAVRCHQPKDDGPERLRVLVYRASDAGWYYEDITTPPKTCEELEAAIRGLKEKLGLPVQASKPEKAAELDWEI